MWLWSFQTHTKFNSLHRTPAPTKHRIPVSGNVSKWDSVNEASVNIPHYYDSSTLQRNAWVDWVEWVGGLGILLNSLPCSLLWSHSPCRKMKYSTNFHYWASVLLFSTPLPRSATRTACCVMAAVIVRAFQAISRSWKTCWRRDAKHTHLLCENQKESDAVFGIPRLPDV